ncbi:MAG: CDP-glycerol glycerophosphotransferase family protein [Gammaproteobacteria bacterium]|nr:CDP-glycerol glycerophosphotransferase family protein [Gammaproteobacteria bacterium]
MGLLDDWRAWRAIQNLPDDERNIIFYSESGQDWHHFEPVIERLLNHHGRTICYISSDAGDPGLTLEHPGFTTFCIGPGLMRIVLFQFLRADVLVLTMIDLGNHELKRSIHPVHYIHLFHNPGSIHMVDAANAYDQYDTILCAMPHQYEELRARERLAGLPARNLVKQGYPRINALIEESRRREGGPRRDPPTLLLAPTWGDESILHVCGHALLEVLLEAGFNVILRPHHETAKRHPELIEGLLRHFGDHPRLHHIDRMGDSDSLFDADLMISDWSGIILEYGLGVGRPVLLIDVPPRIHNPDYAALGLEPIEWQLRGRFGDVLAPEHIHEAPERIRAMLDRPGAHREHIEKLRRRYLFEHDNCAEIGAAAIIEQADRRAALRRERSVS